MTSPTKPPSTAATRLLQKAGVAYVPHLFAYEPKGGTRHSSQALGVDEHQVVKTLIFEDDLKKPLCVLMHGDREVSAKALARHLGHKAVRPCAPEVAERHSGYQVGGTSPFGLKRPMPIYAEASIFELERIFINGGSRGFLVELAPAELERVLEVSRVQAAITP